MTTQYAELGNVSIIEDSVVRNPTNEFDVHTVVFTKPRGKKQIIAVRQMHDNGLIFPFTQVG